MPQAGQLCNLICIFRISLWLLHARRARQRGACWRTLHFPRLQGMQFALGLYGKDEGRKKSIQIPESKAMEEMLQFGGFETAVLILHVIFQVQFYLLFAAMHILLAPIHFTPT